MAGIKEELIEELEHLPEEEKDKPIIATLNGQKTPRELIEEIKSETPLGKRYIAGELKRRGA